MAFAFIGLIADMFITVFGSPYLVAAIIIGFILLILLSLRANLEVILMVMIPLIIGISVNSMTSNFINMPSWIIIALFSIAGFMFAGFMIYLMR